MDRRAADAGARVINLSLSTSSYSRVMDEAVSYARQKGAVLVAAYGNEETNSPRVYPADFASVISVVATNQEDRLAPFSNYGRPAHVAAPGVQTVGTFTGSHYAYGDGTSFAAPWVAGLAALLLAKGASPVAVRTQIVGTADRIASANGGANLGYGRINAHRSLTTTAPADAAPFSTGATMTAVQTAWRDVTDGWSSKTAKTLLQDGKLPLVASSDNRWHDVLAGQWASFCFGGGIPADAQVQEARLYVEHYEEAGISSNSVSFQVGVGALASPTVLQAQTVPAVMKQVEAPVEWDVTAWITTGVRANDLKFVVRNGATNGKKVKIDRISLLVRYSAP